jgi:hypothetical protein
MPCFSPSSIASMQVAPREQTCTPTKTTITRFEGNIKSAKYYDLEDGVAAVGGQDACFHFVHSWQRLNNSLVQNPGTAKRYDHQGLSLAATSPIQEGLTTSTPRCVMVARAEPAPQRRNARVSALHPNVVTYIHLKRYSSFVHLQCALVTVLCT